MNQITVRIVAFLLVPCLIADPATARGLLSPAARTPAIPQATRFQQEALQTADLFTRPLLQKAVKVFASIARGVRRPRRAEKGDFSSSPLRKGTTSQRLFNALLESPSANPLEDVTQKYREELLRVLSDYRKICNQFYSENHQLLFKQSTALHEENIDAYQIKGYDSLVQSKEDFHLGESRFERSHGAIGAPVNETFYALDFMRHLRWRILFRAIPKDVLKEYLLRGLLEGVVDDQNAVRIARTIYTRNYLNGPDKGLLDREKNAFIQKRIKENEALHARTERRHAAEQAAVKRYQWRKELEDKIRKRARKIITEGMPDDYLKAARIFAGVNFTLAIAAGVAHPYSTIPLLVLGGIAGLHITRQIRYGKPFRPSWIFVAVIAFESFTMGSLDLISSPLHQFISIHWLIAKGAALIVMGLSETMVFKSLMLRRQLTGEAVSRFRRRKELKSEKEMAVPLEQIEDPNFREQPSESAEVRGALKTSLVSWVRRPEIVRQILNESVSKETIAALIAALIGIAALSDLFGRGPSWPLPSWPGHEQVIALVVVVIFSALLWWIIDERSQYRIMLKTVEGLKKIQLEETDIRFLSSLWKSGRIDEVARRPFLDQLRSIYNRTRISAAATEEQLLIAAKIRKILDTDKEFIEHMLESDVITARPEPTSEKRLRQKWAPVLDTAPVRGKAYPKTATPVLAVSPPFTEKRGAWLQSFAEAASGLGYRVGFDPQEEHLREPELTAEKEGHRVRVLFGKDLLLIEISEEGQEPILFSFSPNQSSVESDKTRLSYENSNPFITFTSVQGPKKLLGLSASPQFVNAINGRAQILENPEEKAVLSWAVSFLEKALPPAAAASETHPEPPAAGEKTLPASDAPLRRFSIATALEAAAFWGAVAGVLGLIAVDKLTELFRPATKRRAPEVTRKAPQRPEVLKRIIPWGNFILTAAWFLILEEILKPAFIAIRQFGNSTYSALALLAETDLSTPAGWRANTSEKDRPSDDEDSPPAPPVSGGAPSASLSPIRLEPPALAVLDTGSGLRMAYSDRPGFGENNDRNPIIEFLSLLADAELRGLITKVAGRPLYIVISGDAKLREILQTRIKSSSGQFYPALVMPLSMVPSSRKQYPETLDKILTEANECWVPRPSGPPPSPETPSHLSAPLALGLLMSTHGIIYGLIAGIAATAWILRKSLFRRSPPSIALSRSIRSPAFTLSQRELWFNQLITKLKALNYKYGVDTSDPAHFKLHARQQRLRVDIWTNELTIRIDVNEIPYVITLKPDASRLEIGAHSFTVPRIDSPLEFSEDDDGLSLVPHLSHTWVEHIQSLIDAEEGYSVEEKIWLMELVGEMEAPSPEDHFTDKQLSVWKDALFDAAHGTSSGLIKISRMPKNTTEAVWEADGARLVVRFAPSAVTAESRVGEVKVKVKVTPGHAMLELDGHTYPPYFGPDALKGFEQVGNNLLPTLDYDMMMNVLDAITSTLAPHSSQKHRHMLAAMSLIDKSRKEEAFAKNEPIIEEPFFAWLDTQTGEAGFSSDIHAELWFERLIEDWFSEFDYRRFRTAVGLPDDAPLTVVISENAREKDIRFGRAKVENPLTPNRMKMTPVILLPTVQLPGNRSGWPKTEQKMADVLRAAMKKPEAQPPAPAPQKSRAEHKPWHMTSAFSVIFLLGGPIALLALIMYTLWHYEDVIRKYWAPRLGDPTFEFSVAARRGYIIRLSWLLALYTGATISLMSLAQIFEGLSGLALLASAPFVYSGVSLFQSIWRTAVQLRVLGPRIEARITDKKVAYSRPDGSPLNSPEEILNAALSPRDHPGGPKDNAMPRSRLTSEATLRRLAALSQLTEEITRHIKGESDRQAQTAAAHNLAHWWKHRRGKSDEEAYQQVNVDLLQTLDPLVAKVINIIQERLPKDSPEATMLLEILISDKLIFLPASPERIAQKGPVSWDISYETDAHGNVVGEGLRSAAVYIDEEQLNYLTVVRVLHSFQLLSMRLVEETKLGPIHLKNAAALDRRRWYTRFLSEFIIGVEYKRYRLTPQERQELARALLTRISQTLVASGPEATQDEVDKLFADTSFKERLSTALIVMNEASANIMDEDDTDWVRKQMQAAPPVLPEQWPKDERIPMLFQTNWSGQFSGRLETLLLDSRVEKQILSARPRPPKSAPVLTSVIWGNIGYTLEKAWEPLLATWTPGLLIPHAPTIKFDKDKIQEGPAGLLAYLLTRLLELIFAQNMAQPPGGSPRALTTSEVRRDLQSYLDELRLWLNHNPRLANDFANQALFMELGELKYLIYFIPRRISRWGKLKKISWQLWPESLQSMRNGDIPSSSPLPLSIRTALKAWLNSEEGAKFAASFEAVFEGMPKNREVRQAA